MAELAPGGEHRFSQQRAVTEDLRHRQAGGMGGHLEVVQIHGTWSASRSSMAAPTLSIASIASPRSLSGATPATTIRNAQRPGHRAADLRRTVADHRKVTPTEAHFHIPR